MTDAPLGVAVFASGGGSNFQALLDHASKHPDPAWRVVLLVCNREAGAIQRARAAGVPAVVIPTKDRATADVAEETLALLARHDVTLLALAGYLRLLPPAVVERFRGRILNIHPALLPDFGGKGMYGMHVHRAVVKAGVRESGATVHLADEVYDRGAVLAQARVPVHESDSPEDVQARVLAVEHELYPRVVDHAVTALRAGRPIEPMTLAPTPANPTEDER